MPPKIRRAAVSLKRDSALSAKQVLSDKEKLVYILVADKKLKYPSGRSRIAYIGTTKKGGSRVAQSVATRAPAIFRLHGVRGFDARIVTCKPRQRVRMWRKLERALLLAFREEFGLVPKCNIQGKGTVEKDEFQYFARPRIKRIIEDVS
jgi:hypothetical protein